MEQRFHSASSSSSDDGDDDNHSSMYHLAVVGQHQTTEALTAWSN